MKTIYTLILLLSCSIITAQTSLKEVFKYNDAAALDTYVNDKNKNNCKEMASSSYNLLALSIKLDAPKVFERLVKDYKVDLEKSCAGKTPLMYAAKYGRPKMVQLLLKGGAKADAKSPKGRTAYDYAIKYDHDKIAALLK